MTHRDSFHLGIMLAIAALAALLFSTSCGGGRSSGTGGPGGPTTAFSKLVVVFGVQIYATNAVPDDKVLHAARVMAEYLDNNEDGQPDDTTLTMALEMLGAHLVMFRDAAEESAFLGMLPPGSGQNLYASETHPSGSTPGAFDATLEEVLHLISGHGYMAINPAVFGETEGSELANAMDRARGGRFALPPATYPASAWYTYQDQTCDYACQVTEYFYWALTSWLGAQEFPGREAEIRDEWRLNTPGKLQTGDPDVHAILINPAYKLPTVLPDGTYGGGALTITRL